MSYNSFSVRLVAQNIPDLSLASAFFDYLFFSTNSILALLLDDTYMSCGSPNRLLFAVQNETEVYISMVLLKYIVLKCVFPPSVN